MSPRIQVWNLLHDGEITAISEEQDEPFVMFVSIPYLRRRMSPLGDSFILSFYGLSSLTFKDFNGRETSLREEIETASIEILSTDSTNMPVVVATTMGDMTMRYEDVQIALDTGQIIDFSALEEASEGYWTEWKARAESSR